jgi:hypothetical protein
MSAGGRKSEEDLDKLVLDIKGFVLLQESEEDLSAKVKQGLVDSVDVQVAQFVNAVRSGGEKGTRELTVIGLGELLLASIFVIAGTLILVPAMEGLNAELESQFSFSLPVSKFYAPIEFLIALFLMVSAFYTLRKAAEIFRTMTPDSTTRDR